MDENEFIKRVTQFVSEHKLKEDLKITAIEIDGDDPFIELLKIKTKMIQCLPCIEQAFGRLNKLSEEKDTKARVGQLTMRVLYACIGSDIERQADDYSERLLITLLKFCELTGLDKDPRLKLGEFKNE